MKKFFGWVKFNWRPIVFSIISISVLLFVSAFQLESLTRGNLSHIEVSHITAAASGKKILQNPLFLPYKIGIYGVLNFGGGSIYLLRAVSAFFGVLLVLLFYALARVWFSPRLAWMASIMLATSSLFLNYSRLAVPDILLPLALLGLLACGWWVFRSHRASLALVVTGVVFAACLYIPGVVWFLLLIVFIQRRHIRSVLSKLSPLAFVGFLIVGTALIAPLARSLILMPHLINDWLALPTSWQYTDIIRNFLYVPASLVVRSQPNPAFNLGRLPYLDIFTIALVVLGTYAYMIRAGLVRTKALIGSVAISWLLIAFANTVSIVILLPLIYLTAAGGILFMLQQWYSVFPKNPIARSIGIILMMAVILLSIFYNTNRYFVAWPNSPITRLTFVHKLPKNLVQ